LSLARNAGQPHAKHASTVPGDRATQEDRQVKSRSGTTDAHQRRINQHHNTIGDPWTCCSHTVGTHVYGAHVQSDDDVDPGDAAIQALLAAIAANTHDPERREKLLDAILTIPPLTGWLPDCREKLWETCEFVISLSRDLRRWTETRDGGAD
jgi:hypothetical protein